MKGLFRNSKMWKFGLGFLLIFILFLLLFPILFKDRLQLALQNVLDKQLDIEVGFSELNVSLIRHFPSLTVSMDELFLEGSAPFQNDTLLYTKELALGISIPSLFSGNYTVDELYLKEAVLKLMRDQEGNSNFDVVKSNPSDSVKKEETKNDLKLEIEKFFFKNSSFLYQDTSLDMICKATGIDYKGSGILENENFNLTSDIGIDELQLLYEDFPILNRNRVLASLLTQINTESTSLTFLRNELQINELPMNFVGKLEFIPGGYDMNFVLESFDSNLGDILTLVPQDLIPDLAKTRFSGKGDIVASLQGLYLPTKNEMPALVLNMGVSEGGISHENAPEPIKDLGFRMNLRLPALDPEQIEFDLDSLNFALADGFLLGDLHVRNLNPTEVNSVFKSDLDLGLLQQALGTKAVEYQGKFKLDLNADGYLKSELDPKELRNPQVVWTRIPKFNLQAGLSEGYFKQSQLPEGIQDISFDLKVTSPDSLPENLGIALDKLNFQVLDQVTSGSLSYNLNLQKDVNANLISSFDLADIPKYLPLDSSYVLNGKITMDLKASGKHNSEMKEIPIIQADFKLEDGFIQTPFHPESIQDLSVLLSAKSSSASYSDLKIEINPIQFNFANQPFSITANLENMEDLTYDMRSEGRLDLGKLYQVFGMEGYDLDGFLITDFRLKGKQSDAVNGNLQKLDNQGTIQVQDIISRSDLLPLPIDLKKGLLEFNQEKITFSDFVTSYNSNEITVAGYFSNYLGYAIEPGELLKGEINLSSSFLDLDDFMFFGEESSVKVDSLGTVSGVIVPPQDVDVKINAKLDSIHFGEIMIRNFNGNLSTKPGIISLDKTDLELVGANISMKGNYQATDPFSATFAYQIDAKEFDINRAYQEIPMFREMASFAEYANGIASLNYNLEGKINAQMEPILPSIKGNGVLGLKKVKLKGFKLMNTIAKETENTELEDPDLNDVEIETTIENNLLTIPRTRLRIAGFRPRFEGQVSLDGDMSIAFRLGLPPLGIFGIPIKITGNQEEPNIEVGKMTEGDALEEVKENN
ncbi:AsmA family protein [Algoriphagus machipongonensis]|uniref:AsmA domain-containing protein n=1 Tax=Algoriphagus machipongonensis TaxID=388413 RepID=A3I060_9BACT|nr:AsmA-like C-terminal region-containing protein [Algoriphagus machipongonensis]EAZ79856.1 hypothetical protein ALPR1_14544 [Algoriphagus machipongonensis]